MNDMQEIPFIAYESSMARMERTNRRLFIAIIISIVLLFASNAIWLYAWMQYDYSSEDTSTTYEYSQDGQGYNNINTGEQGDVINGASLDDNYCEEETKAPEE